MKLSKLISKSQFDVIANDWIWNARNKTILYKKLEGYTYDELAEMYNLTPQRIKEIVKECKNIIIEHI